MHENAIATRIVDAAYHLHRALGPGLFESVYQALLGAELGKRGLKFETEVPLPVFFDGITFDLSFRADMIVEGKVLVEIKAQEKTARVHRRQVLTYLRVSGLHLGLLVNFGTATIKEGLLGLVNNLPE